MHVRCIQKYINTQREHKYQHEKSGMYTHMYLYKIQRVVCGSSQLTSSRVRGDLFFGPASPIYFANNLLLSYFYLLFSRYMADERRSDFQSSTDRAWS